MNRLALPGRVWIASDIHLGPDVPATAAAFHSFLEQAARQADTLILAGDIFDAWIGDDVALKAPEPWLRDSLAALRQTATRLPLWIGRGNRDFLIGPELLHYLGARQLPEPALLDTDAGTLLLAHGDEYCTGDPGYQRFRRLVRMPAVQRAYLALPLQWRKGIAAWARSRSMHANQYKTPEIMDVNRTAVIEALRDTDAHTLIHGHTHRPGRHTVEIGTRRCERWVLPDWDFDHADKSRGGWILIDDSGVRIVHHDQAAASTAHAGGSGVEVKVQQTAPVSF